jgi:hypothetical protein
LRVAHSFSRLYALGWLGLYDQRPQPNHLETDWGLLDWRGNRKPAYYTYRDG